jgi:multidrug efflux system membrane fusion protein
MRNVWTAAAIAAALAGCDKPAPAAFERPPAPVVVARAVTQDVPLYLDEIGHGVARELVNIQPQVSGRITQIHFVDGADLKSGDLLFTIDPRPFQALQAAALASLAQSKASLDLARLDFARTSGLLERKAASQQDFDTAKNSVSVGEARVQESGALHETARLNLEYCSIRSPIEGRAGHRLVDVGNNVAANAGSLLCIQRVDPIYADFTVTEHELPTVQRHREHGTLGVEVRTPDEPGAPHPGELTFIDNAVQEGTGTVQLRATIPNADRRLWPGQFLKVRLLLTTLKGAVLVPAAAPQMSAKGPFVYVVKEDSTAELRPVTLGQRQDDRVVIESGLKPGERVVTVGHIGIMPGGKVKVEEPRAADGEAGKP